MIRRWWPVFALLLIITASAGIGYAAGYRIGPNITLVKTRTLTITDLPVGANIFADYAPRGTSTSHSISIALVPGSHTILVTANNYASWASIVDVPSNADAHLRALLVPKAASGTLLAGTEAATARKRIDATALPTSSQPLALADGCALVSVAPKSHEIIATPTTTPSCTPPPYLCAAGTCTKTIIYSSSATPSAVVAYPGRQDALLALIGQNVYALSLDPRAPRTFVQVLHGIDPHMGTLQNGTVVISDQASVYTLNL